MRPILIWSLATLFASALAASDPRATRAEPRVVEPRLSVPTEWHACTRQLRAGHIVEQAHCAIPHISPRYVSMTVDECGDMTRTREDAVRLLVQVPICTDAVVAHLETVASAAPQAAILTDLAAAYYVRAQRADDPSDFVRALDAADSAVTVAPQSREARFNQALALEALGFSDDAIASWDRLRTSDRGRWAAEEEAHWKRLSRERARRLATRWSVAVEQLPEAVQAGDRKAVERLISPYRAAALRYLEETVLPAWARASANGRPDDAKRQLALARTIATELARLTGDRYALDGVNGIRSSNAERRAALERGIVALAEGRQAQIDFARAAERYRSAETDLAVARSPFRAAATLGRAIATLFEKDGVDKALPLLVPVERQARRHNYRYLLARVHTTRAYILLRKSRYVDSLAQYDAAEAIFARTKDQENLGNVHMRKIGILRTVGDQKLEWREAFQAWRYATKIVDVPSLHLLLGESALASMDIDRPSIALRYQNAAVRLIEDDLATTKDASPATVANLRANLGIAMRARADIRIRLGDFDLAKRDLSEAVRLFSDRNTAADQNTRTAMVARAREVEGKLLLESDARSAIASFTEAHDLAAGTYYWSYSALLLFERAEARLRAGDRRNAEADLKAAFAELRRERREMLHARERGQIEAIWSSYSTRFRDLYNTLIGQLLEEGKTAEAFAYLEQTRALEVLDLLLQFGPVPVRFRNLTRDGEPIDLAPLRSTLPDGTFLIEYCVLDEKSYAWVVWRDDVRVVPVAANAREVAAWTAKVLNCAQERRNEAFDAALAAPSAALLRAPLAVVAQVARARKLHPRVVFVPDRPMQGLPFAALTNPHTRHRLIQDFPVALAPSATLYALSLARNDELPTADGQTVLLVGDPAFDEKLDIARGLSRLRGALREAERIGAIYRGSEVIPLEGPNAKIHPFLDAARRSTIVNFAGHAVSNPTDPFRSLLLFAPSVDDSGALDAEQLLSMLHPDRARVFVLSACSTAAGGRIGTEGLGPLVRPIIAAGVPAVIGSLWKVGDDDAEELLVHFHRHFHDGADADRALQLAQLDMLHNRDKQFNAATAWASFQLIGFASSPFPASGESGRRR